MLVRTDLPLEQQIVQAVHAAHESGRHLAPQNESIDSVVVCRVDSEQKLMRAHDRLERQGIRTVLFREPDIGNQATALATEPVNGSVRKSLSKYPLWKGNQ